MTDPSSTSLPKVDLQHGKPPMLRVDATDDAPRWAAEHRDALLPPSSSTVGFSFAVSGCATWPRLKPSFGGSAV